MHAGYITISQFRHIDEKRLFHANNTILDVYGSFVFSIFHASHPPTNGKLLSLHLLYEKSDNTACSHEISAIQIHVHAASYKRNSTHFIGYAWFVVFFHFFSAIILRHIFWLCKISHQIGELNNFWNGVYLCPAQIFAYYCKNTIVGSRTCCSNDILAFDIFSFGFLECSVYIRLFRKMCTHSNYLRRIWTRVI